VQVGDLVQGCDDGMGPWGDTIGLIMRVEMVPAQGYIYHVSWLCNQGDPWMAQHWEEEVKFIDEENEE